MRFIVFAITLLPSALIAENQWTMFWGTMERSVGLSGLLIPIFMAYYMQKYFTSRDWKEFEYLLSSIGVIYGCYAIAQFIGYSPFKFGRLLQPSNAFAGNTNITGNVAALCLPFLLHYGRAIPIGIGIAGLLLSQSRGAIIASAIVTILWYFPKRKGEVLAILTGLFLAGRWLFTTGRIGEIFHYEESLRARVIQESWPLISFFGIGSDMYRMKFSPMKSKLLEDWGPAVIFDSTHNIYLDHAISFGAISTVVLLLLMWAATESPRRAGRYSILGAYIWGISSFFTVETNVLFWPILAYCMAGEKEDRW